MASQAATTMCERGFENLFMLSGGESTCPRVHTCVTVHANLKRQSKYFISSSFWRFEGDSTEVSGRNDHRLFSRHLSSISEGTLGSETGHAPPDTAASPKQMAFHLWRPPQHPELSGRGADTQWDQQWVIQFTWLLNELKKKNPEPLAYLYLY